MCSTNCESSDEMNTMDSRNGRGEKIKEEVMKEARGLELRVRILDSGMWRRGVGKGQD